MDYEWIRHPNTSCIESKALTPPLVRHCSSIDMLWATPLYKMKCTNNDHMQLCNTLKDSPISISRYPASHGEHLPRPINADLSAARQAKISTSVEPHTQIYFGFVCKGIGGGACGSGASSPALWCSSDSTSKGRLSFFKGRGGFLLRLVGVAGVSFEDVELLNFVNRG